MDVEVSKININRQLLFRGKLLQHYVCIYNIKSSIYHDLLFISSVIILDLEIVMAIRVLETVLKKQMAGYVRRNIHQFI